MTEPQGPPPADPSLGWNVAPVGVNNEELDLVHSARLLLVCWGNLQSIDCSVAVTMIQSSCRDRVQGPTMRQTTPARDFSLYLIRKPVAICSNSGGIKIILEIRKSIPKNTSPTVKTIKFRSANNASKLDMHPIPTFIAGMAFFSRKDFTCLDRNGAYCFQRFLRRLFGCRSSLNHEDVTW